MSLAVLKLILIMIAIWGLNEHFEFQGNQRSWKNLYRDLELRDDTVSQEIKIKPIDRRPGQVKDLAGVNIENR